MAKTEIDMVRDILDWSMAAEQKLALIAQLVGGKPAVKPAKAAAKAAAAAPAAPAEAPQQKPARRKGPRTTRRSQLWNELKRIAPEDAKSTSYTKVSAEVLESMVAAAKKGK